MDSIHIWPYLTFILTLTFDPTGGGGMVMGPTGNATLDCFNRFNIEKIINMYTTADYDSESEYY